MMTNYKEGVWYPWNGGKCPVPGDAKVEIMYDSGGIESGEMSADKYNWSGDGSIVAFSIIEYPVEHVTIPKPDSFSEHVEPLERGINKKLGAVTVVELRYEYYVTAKKATKALKGNEND